jgi:CubicO group peptidase (beta-lactamase class C family)
MRHFMKHSLAILLPALSACPVDGASLDDDDATDGPTPNAEAPWDPRCDAISEQFADQLQAFGAPGASLGILLGGEMICARGFGQRGPHDESAAADTTLYRIGSVTKVLTATALLHEVEDGTASLDALVADVLPDLEVGLGDEHLEQLRVENLLTHSSGLNDYLLLRDEVSDDALLDFFTSDYEQVSYFMAPPGRFWNYTNPGYMLAGLVAQESAGVEWWEHLRQSVLAPLGMDRSSPNPEFVMDDGDFAVGAASDWETGEPYDAEPDSYDNGWGRPAGYLYSSVYDLGRFVRFLGHGDPSVLSPDGVAALQAPHVDTEMLLDKLSYGYGLLVSEGFWSADGWQETPYVSHGGAISGFSAEIAWLPEPDVAVVTLASGDGAYFGDTIAAAFVALGGVGDPETAPDLGIDPEDFDAITGTYEDSINVGELVVTREGDSLSVSAPRLDDLQIPYETELAAVSPWNFSWTVQGYPLGITFIRDESGQGEYFRARQFVAARVDAGDGDERSLGARPPGALPTSERLRRLLRPAALEAPLPALLFNRGS